MWAADTNLLVRYYTRDDERQTRRALQWLLAHAPCRVPLSVAQELYWVLESTYGLPIEDVLNVLQHLCTSPAFEVQSANAVQRALDAARQGIEFPDALHWALSADCEGLATFDDKGFARRARKLRLQPPVSLPT
ncbi:MAG: type II toxin-antitoxin system VapC family toxin [Pseudomonadota bacterium]